MTMPPFSQQNSSAQILENPEIFAGSLAHILHKENGKMTVVGQAWLAGPNKLITCGHVVEPFLSDSSRLAVTFPASGNQYSIDSIRLHPNFNREADQLVKFDAAVLSIRLRNQELLATPLPLRYEQTLKNQGTLWTFRYPAHLGALSSAPDPLKQSGQYLGRLRKQDYFHLLHDLPLSPGDSGAALFSEEGVVGIHCGDTASLPGLNLPTTSIRLALWVDALKDLGIERVVTPLSTTKKPSLLYHLSLGLLSAGMTIGALTAILAALYPGDTHASEQSPAPVSISLLPLSPNDNRVGSINLTMAHPSHLYVLFNKKADKTYVVYPTNDAIRKGLSTEGTATIALPEDLRTDWQKSEGDLYIVAMKPDFSLLNPGDLVTSEGKTLPLIGDTQAFWIKVKDNQNLGAAISQEVDYPATGVSETQKGAADKPGQ